MSISRVIQSDLSAGEMSADLRARVDVQAYFRGAERLENFLPRLTGGADKRAGLEDMGAVIDQAHAPRLVPFVMGRDIAYVLEFGENVCKIRDRATGQFLQSGGADIVLATPWAAADLDGIWWTQSASVMFIAHADRNQVWQVIKRFDDTTWTISPFTFRDGPFLSENNSATTLSFSAVTKGASTTVTASTSLFSADMVGGLLLARPPVNALGVDLWQENHSYTAGDRVANQGRVYSADATGTSGYMPPLHDDGSASDGRLSWTFVHDGYGVVEITGYTSATSVTGTVKRTLPLNAAQPTKQWAEGAFSPKNGYPACGVLHEERVVAANTPVQPDTVHLSRTSDFDPDGAGFRRESAWGVVADDDAISATIADGEVNEVTALVSAKALYLLTEGNVKRISGPSPDEPITPAGRVAREVTGIGCRKRVRPKKALDAVIYAAADGRRLMELRDGFPVRNLAFRSRHALGSPLTHIDFAENPDQMLFLLRADGRCWAVTYDQQENIVAFAQLVPGGAFQGGHAVIESLAVIPGADNRDTVWLAVKRTINGATSRRIERLARVWDENRDRADEQAYLDAAVLTDHWNGDAGKTMTLTLDDAGQHQPGATAVLTASGHAPFTSGDVGKEVWLRKTSAPPLASDEPGPLRVQVTAFTDAATVAVSLLSSAPAALTGMSLTEWAFADTAITGLGHLDGESVMVLRDGTPDGPYQVSGGAITLDEPSARCWAGLAYTALLRSMPIEVGSRFGSGRGAVKHVEEITLIFKNTTGGRIGRTGAVHSEVIAPRLDTDPLGRAPAPATRDVVMHFDNAHDRALSIELSHDDPTAATVLGLAAKVTVHG